MAIISHGAGAPVGYTESTHFRSARLGRVKRLRIYIDTSVIGGCSDPEFKVWSDALIEDFKGRRYVPVLSDVIAAEIDPAPAVVRTLHRELLSLPAEIVEVSDEALSLVDSYSAQGILGSRFYNDMLHIIYSPREALSHGSED